MLQGLGIVVCLVVGFGMVYLIYGRDGIESLSGKNTFLLSMFWSVLLIFFVLDLVLLPTMVESGSGDIGIGIGYGIGFPVFYIICVLHTRKAIKNAGKQSKLMERYGSEFTGLTRYGKLKETLFLQSIILFYPQKEKLSSLRLENPDNMRKFLEVAGKIWFNKSSVDNKTFKCEEVFEMLDVYIAVGELKNMDVTAIENEIVKKFANYNIDRSIIDKSVQTFMGLCL